MNHKNKATHSIADCASESVADHIVYFAYPYTSKVLERLYHNGEKNRYKQNGFSRAKPEQYRPKWDKQPDIPNNTRSHLCADKKLTV